jgi:hypothetical protein
VAAAMAGLAVEILETGAIVGTVDIVTCELFTPEIADELREAQSYIDEWTPSLYAWRLERPLRLPEPIPYRGKLGLFRVYSASVDGVIPNAVRNLGAARTDAPDGRAPSPRSG